MKLMLFKIGRMSLFFNFMSSDDHHQNKIIIYELNTRVLIRLQYCTHELISENNVIVSSA